MAGLFEELKRRNVVRVGVAYVVMGWIIMQVIDVVVEPLHLPEWTATLVLVLLLVGLPVTLFLAWAFELTPQGLKKTEEVETDQSIAASTGQKLNYVIIVTLIAALGFFIWERQAKERVLDTGTSVNTQEIPDSLEDEAAPSPAAASIAVLPFVDLSPEGDQAYFSDGIAEEILNVLARQEGLKVASRTSSFQFKGQTAIGIPFIARELGVRHVLEGSVRKSGDSIRVTAQLIDAETDLHLWSETFDRTLTAENVFAIQDEIANAIVIQLGDLMDVRGVAQTIKVSAGTQSIDAYDLYLKAQARFVARGTENLRESIRLSEQVTELDPNFARAWSVLAAAYVVAPSWLISDRDYADLAESAAMKAIELNPDTSLAYAALGFKALYFRPFDYERALEVLDIAITNDPQDPAPLYWRSEVNRRLGYFERTRSDLEACLDIDPLYPLCRRDRWILSIMEGDMAGARAQIQQAILDGIYTIPLPSEILLFSEEGHRALLLFMIKSWVEFGLGEDGSWAIAPLFKGVIDPAFDRQKGVADFNARLLAQGFDTSKMVTFYMGNILLLGDTDQHLEPTALDYHWHPRMARAEHRQQRRQLIRDLDLPNYWREYGFPPRCRPIGDDDFECD